MAMVDGSPSFVSLKITNSLSSLLSEKRYPTSDTIGDLKVHAMALSSNKCTPKTFCGCVCMCVCVREREYIDWGDGGEAKCEIIESL